MGLKGDLGELPLPDLVQMTSVGARPAASSSSTRRMSSPACSCSAAGGSSGAHSGELSAEKAFYALLGLKTGSFDFDPTAEVDEGDVNLSTESLLIEGMRRSTRRTAFAGTCPAPALVRYARRQLEDPLEVRVLGYLAPGARTVGDVVEGILVGGDADEYDALHALRRLAASGTVRVELPWRPAR